MIENLSSAQGNFQQNALKLCFLENIIEKINFIHVDYGSWWS